MMEGKRGGERERERMIFDLVVTSVKVHRAADI